MKKTIFLVLMILLFVTCKSKSQVPKTEEDRIDNLVKESNEYIKAFTSLDAEKIVFYSNELFILDNGGKDSYLDMMKKSCKEFKDRNDKIINLTLSKPDSIIRIGNVLFCVLHQTTHESFGITGEKTYDISNTVIASSNDSGISWKFLGLHGLNDEKIEKYIPGFSYQRFGIKKKE